MTPLTTLSRALTDPLLFGKVFAAPSFWTWRVVAKLLDGMPLTEPREIELFRECTGRSKLPDKPVQRLILLAGRRAGKDRFLSAVACWRAALCANWRQHISAGEQAVVILLGADKKQASILRRYCEGLLRSPLLAAEVTRTTGEVTEFKNGASLEITTNDQRLVRGRSAIAVLGSEAAHWKTNEYSSSSDEEVVSAAVPSLAMCPGGGLLLLGSSVHRKIGYMHRMFKRLHGNDDSADICWFAPSRVMNPVLPAHVIDKALAEDGSKAKAEYENIWREDLSDFIPPEVVDAATDWGVHERAPEPGIDYVAFCDCSSGVGDSFAIAIASKGPPHMLHVVRERKPRFIPGQVIAEFAELLKQYGIDQIQSDSYAIGFHQDEWRRHNIKLIPCEHTTSENYLRVLPLLMAGTVRLVDNATLRHQLSSLERKVGAGDREQVSHPAYANAHDDVSCAACGALALCAKYGNYELPGFFGVCPDGTAFTSPSYADAQGDEAAAERQQELDFLNTRLMAHIHRFG
jgi:hypothetical protein